MATVLDRLRATIGITPTPVPRHLAASARMVSAPGGTGAVNGRGTLRRAEAWQQTAFSMFDRLGEVHAAFSLFGNGLSKVRMFPAWRYAADQPPVPLDEALELEDVALRPPAGLVADALSAWEALEASQSGLSRQGGVAGLLSEHGLHLGMVGESLLWGRTVDGQETWEALSVSEVVQRQGRHEVIRHPAQRKGEPVGPDDFLLRIWRPHPQYSDLASSSLRPLLDEAELLLLLQAGDLAIARSRVVNSGLLYMDNTLDFGGDAGDPTGEEPSSFVQEMVAEGIAGITDPASPSAVFPLVVTGSGPLGDRITHVAMPRPLDEVSMRKAEWAVRRLAMGVDLPAELMLGMSDVNHWTAWQVDEATWKVHLEPTVMIIDEAYGHGYLRPRVAALDVWDPALLSRLTVWHDGTAVIVPPDRSTDAHRAYAEFALSTDAYLTALGFNEADRPDDDELARRLLIKAAIVLAQVTGTAPSAEDLRAGKIPVMPDGPAGVQVLSLTRAAAELTAGRTELTAAADAGDVPAVRELDRLAERLADMDAGLLDRLQVAADAAARRVLDRAGNRVVSSARRSQDALALIRDVPTRRVPATLGRARVAGFGLAEQDLVADGLDDLRAEFDRQVDAVQADALAAVAAVLPEGVDLDVEAVRAEQAEDRQEAWGWLAAAMTAILTRALFDSGDAGPSEGEVDVHALVPYGTLREAVARAGGAASGVGSRVAARGMDIAVDLAGRGAALSVRLFNVLAAGGVVEAAIRWRYGVTPRATFPPHLALDGMTFTGRDDEGLRNTGRFPAAAFYHPGDHAGCRCLMVPVLRLREPADGT